MIDEILKHNEDFVNNGSYLHYSAGKYPRKKLAVLSCMDTRLVELLPAALGIKDGDVKMIKNAGAVITDPFDTTVRSLIIAVLELGVEEIMVIGHTDCGVQGMDGEKMVVKLESRGIPKEHIDIIRKSGISLEQWLGGFESAEEAVKESVESLKNHPLMPKDIVIRGFMMDSVTGELSALS